MYSGAIDFVTGTIALWLKFTANTNVANIKGCAQKYILQIKRHIEYRAQSVHQREEYN